MSAATERHTLYATFQLSLDSWHTRGCESGSGGSLYLAPPVCIDLPCRRRPFMDLESRTGKLHIRQPRIAWTSPWGTRKHKT